MKQNLENQIRAIIRQKRKALLDLMEVSMNSESFERARRFALNLLGDKGLEGEVRKILADFNQGRAGPFEKAKGVVRMVE